MHPQAPVGGDFPQGSQTTRQHQGMVLPAFRRWGRLYADPFAYREAHHLPRHFICNRQEGPGPSCTSTEVAQRSVSDHPPSPPPRPLTAHKPGPRGSLQPQPGPGQTPPGQYNLILMALDWQDPSWYRQWLTCLVSTSVHIPTVRIIQTTSTQAPP